MHDTAWRRNPYLPNLSIWVRKPAKVSSPQLTAPSLGPGGTEDHLGDGFMLARSKNGHSSLACVYDVASVSTWLENAASKRERPPKLFHGFCLFDLTFAVPNDISASYVAPPPAKNSVSCTTSCEASHLFISNRRTLRPLLTWRCASMWRYPRVSCTDFGDSTTTAPRPR